MKKILLFIIPILISCGTVNKLKHKTETKTDIKSDSLSDVKSITSSTVTEQVDTTAYTKIDSVKNQISESSLNNGDTNIIETNTIEIKTFKDKNTNTIKEKVIVKPQSIDLKINKKTISNNTTHTNTDVKKHTKSDVKENDKTVKRTGISLGFWGWFWIILIIILVIAYCIFRKYLKTIFPFLP
ncbi:MAG TPA: hypothetical protein VN922_19525 [Bacteroidia bacterium]|nr:hypothetical protein [Bacteroidia bacterium]